MSYVLEYFAAFWQMSCIMAPWLLFGFLAAGLLSIFFSPEFVRAHLGSKGLAPVVKAALFGVPLPLCSCGVVPVAVALKKEGAAKGAVGSFLISTPQTGADSILVTFSMLGWLFAIFKPLIAFVTGIIGGVLIDKFGGEVADKPPCEAGGSCHCEHSNGEEKEPGESHCCAAEAAEKAVPGGIASAVVRILHYGFIKLLGDIAVSLLVGLALAALITMMVPGDFGARYLHNEFLSFGAMILFGIPLYVCSSASVPIAAALVAKGISPGAALVFLIAGPATNAATIAAMTSTLGKKATVIYLGTVAVCAVLAGLALNALNVNVAVTSKLSSAHPHLGIVHYAAGLALLALIAYSILKNLRRAAETDA